MARVFINELGNRITINVENPNDDVEIFDRPVKITMTGPDSVAEWIVTYKEALMLRRCLIDEGC